jgi:6-pyruvoyltetrahydropterin/6-carboxytetrahydropterin synthase
MLDNKLNIRITKEFHFEMAHALTGYDGPCKHIHGHSYQLAITVIGSPSTKEWDAKEGMVADFSDLKAIVNKVIIAEVDHALMLNKRNNDVLSSALEHHKLILTDFQPTCENMLIYFVKKIQPELPDHITLHHILLRETGSSFAEWYAEDN